ncbi:nitroreductase family deazaflavin-dependent oxidoreductase [Amycolatopsis thailandensis]|uniref:nitroreductase family deazaflavin-dependent oxidoreductase n=1 Tax=Amycolatopsis thailandensis TaxID=589330 RepID=UPI003636B5AA
MIRHKVNAFLWKTMVRLAPKPWFITFMRKFMVPADRFLLNRTRGRFSLGGTTGAGTLLLTTTGRRSGKARSTPLFFMPHGESFAVAASNFGRRNHPDWSANLLVFPEASVTIGNRIVPVTARLLHGAEHDAIWSLYTGAGPAYQNYLDASGRGSFRIFALEKNGIESS